MTDSVYRQDIARASDAVAPAVPALLLLLIQGAIFMVSAEARVIAPLLPAVAADFHTSIADAGLLISAYALPYGLFQLVYGPLADRFSRQRMLSIALLLFALGTLVSGFMPSLGALTAVRICTGAAAAGVMPVALAYISDAVPYATRQAVLGRLVSIAAFGGVISAALGGVIAALVSWRVLFIGYGALALVVAVLLLRVPVRRVRPAGAVPAGMLAPYRAIVAVAGARGAALFGLVFFEGFAAISTIGYLGALLFERDQLSYGTIGVLLTLNGVGTMLAARMAGRLVARLGEQAMVLAGGTAIALFAFALLLGSGLGTYVAGQAIAGFGFTPTLLGTAGALALFTVIAAPLLRAGRPAGA